MSLNRFKEIRLGVGVPSNGFWCTDFAVNFVYMMLYFRDRKVGEYKDQMCQVISTKGSTLTKSRREIVKIALERKLTHLLWIDSDHTFPPSMIHRLVHHEKDIVAVNHVTKCIPANPTARYAPKDGDPLFGTLVYSDENSPELEKVWRVGCGTMLVNMKVFQAIGPNVFDMKYLPVVDDVQGEDWSMCEAFEKAGFDIWVDHPLSLRCGHIGQFEYNHSLVGVTVREPIEEAA